jgi:hypothetical protein
MRRADGEVASVLAGRVASIIENQSRPMTTWEVVGRLGVRCGHEVTDALEEMTARGRLAKFQAGLNRYYAIPGAALTEERPLAGTVLADSAKGLSMAPRLWLAWRFQEGTARLQTVSG